MSAARCRTHPAFEADYCPGCGTVPDLTTDPRDAWLATHPPTRNEDYAHDAIVRAPDLETAVRYVNALSRGTRERVADLLYLDTRNPRAIAVEARA